MIPRRIDRRPDVADNYSWLAEYIAAAREKGEKLDRFWIVNCNAGDSLADLKTALIEIEATRALKPRIADKTYHLVVSFRPDDREKLTPEALKDIERTFAEALGYGEHQRAAGTHINTDHFHMHVAYNKVHPETLRVRTPRGDFFALEKAARALERKYGLAVDLGASEGQEKHGDKARVFEAKTWQQSFESHLREHKTEILAAIAAATDWQGVHEALAPFDAELRKRGAGLVFRETGGKRTMKASTLDRSCSLKALEARFGAFEPARDRAPDAGRPPPPKHPYRARPLVRHPGQDRLWRLYRDGRKPPGFLGRHLFNIRSWKDYLLADAHKDLLALAIIVTYREALHLIEGTGSRHARAPKSIVPALRGWFAELPWEAPDEAYGMAAFQAGAGLKVDGEGKVLYPMRDAEGHAWAIQAVDESGRTCVLGNLAARPGLRHVVDPRKRLAPDSAWRGTVVLATSCTAAMAIHKATGLPVVIAARERDLPDLAHEIRTRHPENSLVIAAPAESRAAVEAARIANARAATAEAILAEAPLLPEVARTVGQWAAEAATAGHPVAVDPDLAEAMGAFVDDALTAADAKAAQGGTAVPAAERLKVLGRWVAEAAGKDQVVPVGRDVAEAMGAFVEDALSPKDASASRNQGRSPIETINLFVRQEG